MIEITEKGKEMIMESNSEKVQRIESIVRAWAEIDNDERLNEDQKNNMTRSAMHHIWRIMEGKE